MIMKTLLMAIAICIYSTGYSQTNKMFIGSKIYSCSENISLGDYDRSQLLSSYHSELEIQIIKDGVKGMMTFTHEYGSNHVCGTIVLYLDDNTIITLIDRNQFDKVNEIYTSIYNLTANEIIKLKSTNIYSIRYGIIEGDANLKWNPHLYNQYTISNSEREEYIDNYDGTGRTVIHEKIDFPSIISKLFNN